MKRFFKLGVFAVLAICLTIHVSAVLGKISVVSYISNDGCFVEASGNATETIASPEDTMNIYARTAILDPNDTIIAENEKTSHYTTRVYASCSTTVQNPILGKYYSATLGAVRYVDDVKLQALARSRKIELLQLVNIDVMKEFQASIINRTLNLENTGYKKIPFDALAQETGAGTKSSDNGTSILTEIFAIHFCKAEVGDKMPQLYLSNDGASCFVIDENKEGVVTKTLYSIENNGFTPGETILLN